MCKSRLLLNDMPVFIENRFKIQCGRVVSGNKRYNFFHLLCFVTKSLFSLGELNLSQDFMDERSGIASVTESFSSKSRLYLQKFSLTELVKSHNASPFIKPFSVMNGWQDEKCVY